LVGNHCFLFADLLLKEGCKIMSHHFDTPTAKEDPRINICDFYIFEGSPGTTVMAMTVNPDAGLSGPVTFRQEGLYAFRFDTNGDAKEEVTFKFRFGDVRHPDNDEDTHIPELSSIQSYPRRCRSWRCW
jgi:hypothetical protein